MAPSNTPSNSPVKVTTFPLVRRHLIASTICAALIVFSARRSFIAPGSPIHEYILTPIASLVIAVSAQNWIFGILVGVHSLEVPLFAVMRLHKHGVPFMSALWWKWTGAVFIAGKATWDLFGATVKREAAKAR
ncbi:hypothetical protein BD289DRAFT_365698 [Coniella lustricola]|uniref:Integral membrane protein n=1 Tax=Coniella lustricola TaxID=2025994 RepID=A0A2T3ABY9_9PEZI|nr:hypothetical protein BD289DRAFT_365698 [Coniella lustricola]